MKTLTKKQWGTGVIVLALAVLSVTWWWTHRVPNLIPVDAADRISSWSVPSFYVNDADGAKRAEDEIAKLKGMLGKGEYPDYSLFVNIAQDYEHLGDGKSAYAWLEKAAANDPTTALAFYNAGELMEKLGAPHTARAAYEKAIAAQANVMSYHLALISLLTSKFPDDAAAINAAINAALAEAPMTDIYRLKAEWLAKEGKTADAIAAWRAARDIAGASGRAAIDAQIAKLEAQ